MNYYGTTFWSPTDLTHHGVLGMKWGVRRYQNKDGSLTAAGQRRYLKEFKKRVSKQRRIRMYFDGTPKEWRELYNKQHGETDSLKKKIHLESQKTKEFKDYEKAERDLIRYDSNRYEAFDKSKYLALYDAFRKAEAKFFKKQGLLFLEKRQDLAIAKLKDLGFSEKEYTNQSIIDTYLSFDDWTKQFIDHIK